MLFPLLFCAFIQYDTTTICSASCNMTLSDHSNLVVAEKRLYNRSGEQAEWQPCKKIITDTVKHKSFALDMGDNWVDKLPRKKDEEHIGTVKVTFYRLAKSKIFAVLEPDNCSCKWSTTITKELLPFVKETIPSLTFKEY
jgi:hypothetical protein